MTLNITILTPTVLFQSTDFRLSDGDTGQPLSEPSTKAVPISYGGEWSGYLTYAGVGAGKNGERTASAVQSWLVGTTPQYRSFDEAVELVRSRAYTWLHSNASGRRHSFILAAFVGTQARAAIISNHERWAGEQQVRISDKFFVTHVPAPTEDQPTLVVTGMKSSVKPDERRALELLAREHSNEPLRIRRAIAEANMNAAHHVPDLISEDCFVQSLDQWGNAYGETTGVTLASPAWVFNGIDMDKTLAPLMDRLYGKGKRPGIIQSAGANSRAQSAPVVPCNLRVVNTMPSTHELTFLECPQGNNAQPQAANSTGTIVGHGTLVRGRAHSAYVWHPSGQGEVLGGPGAIHGVAKGVNETGVIVGWYVGLTTQACEWSQGEWAELACTNSASSGARAINAAGYVVGFSNHHSTENARRHRRPVLWTNARTAIIRDEIEGGEGIAINEANTVLVLARTETSARALLWRGDDIEEIGLPDERCVSFFPSFLTPHEVIAGTALDRDGTRREMRRLADGTWETIVLPRSSVVVCGDDDVLVGFDKIAGYTKPWIWPLGEESRLYLPSVEHHHTSPTAISTNGTVLGVASADGCSHPILWRAI